MGSFRFDYDQNGNSQSFSFDAQSTSVGREQSQDFVLDHPTVSRQHAVVVDDGGGQFRLVVLSEGGMTAVDGRRVQGEARLYDGSEVFLGKLKFTFRSAEAPARPSGGQGAQEGQPGQQSRQGGQHPNQWPQQGQQQGQGPQQGGQQPRQGGQQQNQWAQQGQQPQQGRGQQAGQASQNSPASQSGQMQSSGNAASSGGFQASGAADVQQSNTADAKKRAGITSWDEIAESADEEEEEEARSREPDPESLADNLDPHRRAGGDDGGDDETNPALVAVAGVMIIGLLYFIVFYNPGGGGGTTGTQGIGAMEGPKVRLTEDDTRCLAKPECLEKAKNAYSVAKTNFKSGQTGDLFKGYKNLLRAEKFLEKAEVSNTPSEMSDLEEMTERARKKLDEKFRNYRVSFHNGKKNGRHEQMARALTNIQQTFGKAAIEYRWAEERINAMKQRGAWPYGY